MEVCIIEWAVVLDTRWEQTNWLNTPSKRQVDNGEDRLESKKDSWLGNGRGKLELAGWHHLVQEPCLEVNGEAVMD